MSSDYKWDIQERAEELSWDRYDTDFYELSKELQDQVYRDATEGWQEGVMARADQLRDQAKYK